MCVRYVSGHVHAPRVVLFNATRPLGKQRPICDFREEDWRDWGAGRLCREPWVPEESPMQATFHTRASLCSQTSQVG